ncbi:MAG: UDP-GlcNAc:undecaprenyl-phosphate/decaprenyl-phosphate GlcNAc-1-phosphate transferase [Blastocatellia bacterium]|jgi:UDP-GlcNAc:undecaprenyl-phosphate GlcNAc-1-phosphate transferase|nr:UDP-GlcNAc:undecaprenyl-phosphate/decaprenyl-phosphate GlcNAc-1-phosphate transferase [Blastocatellia bacterium]
MQVRSLHLMTVAAALVLSLALTPLVRRLARRRNAVAKPKTDRWHKNPTPMFGGVAIWLAVTLVLAAYLLFVPHETPYGWVVVGASSFLFLIGLADDLLHAKPYQKLIGQVMGAAFVIYYGLSLPWTTSAPVNMAITIFWLIGITNAINLLDNMDGLAAGIAAIASAFLALSFLTTGQTTEALMLAVFAAALVGFLVYNSNPASIFMGDCGSMFVGFFLASTALMSSAMGGRSRSFLPVLAVPILILFIPIFDTTFVTVVRKLSGRAASQGGRDHPSHRLVALGMSERRAVWMLYGFAGVAGLLAMLVREAKLEISLPVILGFTVALTLLGVYLAGVKVYDEEEVKAAHDKPLFAFLIDLSYKRRIFEVLLDVVLIILAYYCAYVLRFGAMSQSGAWTIFLRTLPVLVFVKMATLLVMGVYRGIWRYTGVGDLINIAKAIVIGSVASMLALLFKFRFESLSRTVFILDAMLLLLMLAGSRMAFRLFRQMLPASKTREGCRVLIYGAGDAGELLLRELLNNRELQYAPVGFVDDDPNKKGKVIHGLRVFGGNGALPGICRKYRVDEVLISSTRVSEERIREIKRDCEEQRITLKRMRIEIETISEE